MQKVSPLAEHAGTLLSNDRRGNRERGGGTRAGRGGGADRASQGKAQNGLFVVPCISTSSTVFAQRMHIKHDACIQFSIQNTISLGRKLTGAGRLRQAAAQWHCGIQGESENKKMK